MIDEAMSWRYGSAVAQSAGVSAKEAFEAAKALGSVEAWEAFLSNYPDGFHADLARAYLKKLTEQTPAPPAPRAAGTARPAPPADEFPMVAGSWGGVVRDGPGRDYRQVASLAEGEEITLMGRSDVFEDGFPWFKIAYRDGRIGYKWGGILCSTGPERPDLYKTCPATPPRQTESRRETQRETKRETKREPASCGNGRVAIEGKCIRKSDAASHCGPGYRREGSKCVAGYQPPKPQKQLPSWQMEAIKKGCRKGMGWNAQEGCHEND